MSDNSGYKIDRRTLLTRSVPACAAACAGLCRLPGMTTLAEGCLEQEHKFDAPLDRSLSGRQFTALQNQKFFEFIRIMQAELPEDEMMRLLLAHSAAVGRRAGENQRSRSPDNSFQTYVATFRPPRYANSLTHEVVVDTEKVFELRVTECIWATVYRDAGLDGELGHAALCNMDYHWPTAFNPALKMERNRTLMQGHDHCNHRYIDTT